MLTLKAHAKVNLTLEVLGRRADGFHDVVSVIQTVDLYDIVTFEPADSIIMECDSFGLEPSENLMVKAATLLKEVTGYDGGVRMHLQKNIPVASGLGGGSSDAGATLMGLSKLWDLDLSITDLEVLAARLGSDIPFFLHGGTAMVHGRGELVRLLPPAPQQWFVVLAPDLAIPRKTASMYRELTETNFTRGGLTRKLEARLRSGGDVPPQLLFNTFDAVAFEAFPGLEHYWKVFHSLGAREIHLAGSGPSLFAPVPRKEMATALHLMLKNRYNWNTYMVALWHPSKEGEAWIP